MFTPPLRCSLSRRRVPTAISRQLVCANTGCCSSSHAPPLTFGQGCLDVTNVLCHRSKSHRLTTDRSPGLPRPLLYAGPKQFSHFKSAAEYFVVWCMVETIINNFYGRSLHQACFLLKLTRDISVCQRYNLLSIFYLQ